jgi:glutamate dehydrogenase (NADP+)
MSDSLFSDASKRLETALKYVSISDDAIEHLKYPNQV